MQFRCVDLRAIGPSSQKLRPNQIFGRFPHCNCKTLDEWQWDIYGSITYILFDNITLSILHWAAFNVTITILQAFELI